MRVGIKECVLLISSDCADTTWVCEASANISDAYDVEYVNKLPAALERIDKGGVSAVLLDLDRPDRQGIAAFEKLISAAPDIPILILSGVETEAIARQTLERGAQDYILKTDLHGFRLSRTVGAMIERKAIDEAAFLLQQRAEVTLLCTGDAVLMTDVCNRITEMNPAAEKLTGWTHQKAVGRPLGDVFQIIDG